MIGMPESRIQNLGWDKSNVPLSSNADKKDHPRFLSSPFNILPIGIHLCSIDPSFSHSLRVFHPYSLCLFLYSYLTELTASATFRFQMLN